MRCLVFFSPAELLKILAETPWQLFFQAFMKLYLAANQLLAVPGS